MREESGGVIRKAASVCGGIVCNREGANRLEAKRKAPMKQEWVMRRAGSHRRYAVEPLFTTTSTGVRADEGKVGMARGRQVRVGGGGRLRGHGCER